MPYAQNKPLEEYGDLASQHHSDVQMDAEQRAVQAALEDEPPRLVIYNGPGNLYRIKWTHGDEPLPTMCAGDWNHKGKAQEAIDGAIARLKMDANAQKVLEQAEAAEEAAIHEQEVAAETERLRKIAEAEEAAALEEMEERADREAAASRPKPQAKKKTTTTK